MIEVKNSEDLRRLEDLATCPCYSCVKNCDGMDKVADCVAYQRWYETKMRQREIRRKYGLNRQK